MQIFDRLLSKSHFPKVESVFFESKKNSLIRILAGLIVFMRFWQIENAFTIYNGHLPLFLTGYLIICFFFIIGFMTPLMTIMMMVLSHFIDTQYGTVTLGTTILTELLLVLLYGGAGYYYSVDRLILRSNKKYLEGLKKFSESIYSKFRFAEENGLRKLYFVAFLLYAVSSFTALYLHIKDDYWVGGLTTKSLLSSSYLCYYWDFFRKLENSSPALISILSISGSIFQSIFQFLMILLVWNRWGKAYVFIWGMIFFLISFVLINLSYLPHLEIFLWLIIFIPIKLNKKQVEIYFDDKCNLCVKAMRILNAMNFNNSLLLKPISANLKDIEESGFSEKEIKAYMVGRYKNKYYKGYDLYLYIVLKNPVYWLLVPLFCLGYVFGVGRKIYNYIAENRYKHFGQCELADPNEFSVFSKQSDQASTTFWKRAVFVIYFILIPTFFIIKIVKLDFGRDGNYYVGKFYKAFGLELPDVFNMTDLAMGDKWAEIYRLDPTTGKEILTPIIGLNGERLNYSGINWLYLSNHNSDYLYFGETLGHARNMIKLKNKEELISFHLDGTGNMLLKKRIIYDFNYNRFIGNVKYKVRVYSNSSSRVKHWVSDPERHQKKLELIFDCEYDGIKFNIKQSNNDFI